MKMHMRYIDMKLVFWSYFPFISEIQNDYIFLFPKAFNV